MTVELITQAFIIYEEHLSDSKMQINAIDGFVGTLTVLSCFKEVKQRTMTYTAVLSQTLERLVEYYSCGFLFGKAVATRALSLPDTSCLLRIADK